MCPVRRFCLTLASVAGAAAAQLPYEPSQPSDTLLELGEQLDNQSLDLVPTFGRSHPPAKRRSRLPHSSYLGVYGRAALTLGAVVLAQTIGAASWMGPLREPLQAWASLRAQHALPVTTAGAFLMYAASDTLSQSVAQQSANAPAATIDYRRAARTGVSASVLSGALAYFYYAWLDRAVGVPRALSSRVVPGGLAARSVLPALPIAAKIAIDVGLFEPVYDTLYITLQTLLRGDGLRTAWQEISTKVLGIWAKAPKYWGPLDCINFSLVSLRLRPLFNALATIPWSMYLSAQANAKLTAGEDELHETQTARQWQEASPQAM